MASACVLAIDQGTTSTRAIVFDRDMSVVTIAQTEFAQRYPADGWVEHDPEEIWQTTLDVSRQAIDRAAAEGHRVEAIGITNQRETTIVWDRQSGKPIYNAIVWQDRRTTAQCEALHAAGHEPEFRSRTGLLLDPYFSCTKVSWLLTHVDRARSHADSGELAFGTVDSFLVNRLTGGRVHATDATNASRTGLLNLRAGRWDEELCRLFDVPVSMLPDVRDCNADFGETDPALFGRAIPIRGVAGDQQAAAIGQCCFEPGQTKSTYGTGCFVLMNTGDVVVESSHRLLSTVAYRIDGKTAYSMEGSIFIAGAAVQWLRDGLGIIDSAAETEGLARGAEGHPGLYLVPAFTGLGAPYWKPRVRGAIFGLTRATGRADLARAALEAVCFQTHDLIRAMTADGRAPADLRVDGGMVANEWFVQRLADILDIEIERPGVMETTAAGAAYLAGRSVGLYGDFAAYAAQRRIDARFSPGIDPSTRERLVSGWDEAVSRLVGVPGE